MSSKRRFRKVLKKHSSGSVLDLTAMTDIIFILLIFFVLTSNVAQNVFDLEIPKADENYVEERSANQITEIKITLFTSGEFAIGEQKIQDYKLLKEEIKKLHNKNKEAQFLLITESSLPVQKLMELLTFFKTEKITKVDILLQKQ
jgi:biopolymer transport protein ExbD